MKRGMASSAVGAAVVAGALVGYLGGSALAQRAVQKATGSVTVVSESGYRAERFYVGSEKSCVIVVSRDNAPGIAAVPCG